MATIASTDMMKNHIPASAEFIPPEGLFSEKYADIADMTAPIPAAMITGI